jgi:hypothetical protein
MVVAALTLATARVGSNLNQIARRVNSEARQHTSKCTPPAQLPV